MCFSLEVLATHRVQVLSFMGSTNKLSRTREQSLHCDYYSRESQHPLLRGSTFQAYAQAVAERNPFRIMPNNNKNQHYITGPSHKRIRLRLISPLSLSLLIQTSGIQLYNNALLACTPIAIRPSRARNWKHTSGRLQARLNNDIATFTCRIVEWAAEEMFDYQATR